MLCWQIKHKILCSSKIKFGGRQCHEQPWLSAAHQSWYFQESEMAWRTRCLHHVDLSACQRCFFSLGGLSFASCCHQSSLQPLLKLEVATQAPCQAPGRKIHTSVMGVVFSQVFCWCSLQIPRGSVSLPAGGKYVKKGFNWLPPINCPMMMAKKPQRRFLIPVNISIKTISHNNDFPY